MSIMSLDEGGVIERAGFRVGDVLPDVSEIGLYRLLRSRRGQVAELSVVDGGPGPPFLERHRRHGSSLRSSRNYRVRFARQPISGGLVIEHAGNEYKRIF